MIRHLKRKYITIVMIAVTLVLCIIIASINVSSYTALNAQLNYKLTLIVENEGKMPDFPLPEKPEPDNSDGKDDSADTQEDDVQTDDVDDMRQHMSPETPFETRYFAVEFDTVGTVLSVDTSKIAAVDRSEAEEYARKIYAEGDSNGFL